MSLNPLPKSLSAECTRAGKILNEFCIPGSAAGTDKFIPKGILSAAKGLAIITVVRAGFLVSVRAGSGLVVARLQDGSWSAPSCIGLGGIGGGFNIGGEVTNIIITLNSDQAIKSFTKGGQVTLGGSLSVAAGPMGRNAEADVAVRSPCAFYTYSRTRGLYAGMSIEGAVLAERKGANRKVYGKDVRAAALLAGKYQPPAEARPLYYALEKATGGQAGQAMHAAANAVKSFHDTGSVPMRPSRSNTANKSSRFSFRRNSGEGSSMTSTSPDRAADRAPSAKSQRPGSGIFNRARSGSNSSGGKQGTYETGFDDPVFQAPRTKSKPSASRSQAARSKPSLFGLGNKKPTPAPVKTTPKSQPKPQPKSRRTGAAVALRLMSGAEADTSNTPDWNKDSFVQALFDYAGTMDCDLDFVAGDKIKVVTQTTKRDDWWEGEFKGKMGLFPANYTVDVE
eukprot:m.48360 g.48360  ORF g.48360 m.48360 type:complete len:452 (+) comp13283_c0_seq1:109-1464(+)